MVVCQTDDVLNFPKSKEMVQGFISIQLTSDQHDCDYYEGEHVNEEEK